MGAELHSRMLHVGKQGGKRKYAVHLLVMQEVWKLAPELENLGASEKGSS